MIEIKDKNGKSLFKTELEPKDVIISYIGNLQGITSFKLDKDECNGNVTLEETMLEIFYKYYWGDW